MTEAELIESISTLTEGAGDSVTLYLTTVSAYLLVAYFVGADLDRLQTTIISVLFLFFAVAFVFAIQASLVNMVSIGNELKVIRPDWIVFASTPFNLACLVVDTGGVLASLYFMWHIRHPKIQ
jgi:hypothetical protein